MIHRFKNSLMQYILDMKFKKKLFIAYFVLIILPLLTFTFISNSQISKIIQNNTLYAAKQSFDQAAYLLSARVSNAINISDIVNLDMEASKVFRNLTKKYEISQQMKDYDSLKKFFVNLQRNKSIFRIRLFVPDDLVYTGDRQNFFGLGTVKNEQWYRELTNGSSAIIWNPTTCTTIGKTGDLKSDRVFSALRIVKSPDDFSKAVAVLSVDILELDIISIIMQAANVTKTGIIYLENRNGIIQSSTPPYNANKWKIPEKLLASNLDTDWKRVEINGEAAIFCFKEIANTDWRLVSVIPLEEILSSSVNQKNNMLLLLLIIAGIAYVLAYLVSISSTKRIYGLIDNMRQVQKGNLNVTIVNKSKDEIGELYENFNYMLRRIGELIEQQIKIGQEVKESELKVVQAELRILQAQINPHFLYNTLDIIYWMAVKYNCPDIESTILLLSRFYKASLRKGKDIVTIGDEVAHIQTFIDIYNIRFENSVKLILDTESVNNYMIPKITLQPLVENAVLHGIQKKQGRKGTISIRGYLENDTVILIIQDDGVGMSKEHTENILLHNEYNEVHGFGIKNINDRLKLYFGNEYGIYYSSELGIGTTVEIRMPPRHA